MYASGTVRTSVDVHNFLLEREVAHELFPVGGRFRRPDRIATVLGLPQEHVGRVTLFEGDGVLAAALVPSNRSADPRKVGEVVGSAPLHELGADRIADLTGFLREALPPVALPEAARVVIDAPLAAEEILYFHGGETRSMLKIRSADLIAVTGASVAPVAR